MIGKRSFQDSVKHAAETNMAKIRSGNLPFDEAIVAKHQKAGAIPMDLPPVVSKVPGPRDSHMFGFQSQRSAMAVSPEGEAARGHTAQDHAARLLPQVHHRCLRIIQFV